MGLDNNTKSTIAFKNIVGKSHTDNIKAHGNEKEGIFFSIPYDKVWIDKLTGDITTDTNNGFAVLRQGVFIEDPTSNGHSFFACSNTVLSSGNNVLSSGKKYVCIQQTVYNGNNYNVGETFRATITDLTSGSVREIFENNIDPKYGDDYEIKVYDVNSNRISVGDPRNWLFQYQSGIFYQQDNVGDNPSTFELYQYNGRLLSDGLGTNLYEILSNGNDTNGNDIIINQNDGIIFNDVTGQSSYAKIIGNTFSSNRTISLPDKDGVILLGSVSDGYVPVSVNGVLNDSVIKQSSDGKVTIGAITTPSAKLHVKSNSGVDVVRFDTDTRDSIFIITSSNEIRVGGNNTVDIIGFGNQTIRFDVNQKITLLAGLTDINNGDFMISNGSMGINEAPTTSHFLRISTSDAVTQTVNIRLDVSYQSNIGTYQGINIVSNTPKSGSNSTTYGINSVIQGSITSGTHTYIAGRFKAANATNNYSIVADEGKVLLGTATPIDTYAQVQIYATTSPLNIRTDQTSGNGIKVNRLGQISIFKNDGESLWEALTINSDYNGKRYVRIENSTGFNYSLFKSSGYELYTTYPNVTKNIQQGKIRMAFGRPSNEVRSTFYEGNAFTFVHYNTNRFSSIVGREHMQFFTSGQWDSVTNKHVTDSGLLTMSLWQGKVGVGNIVVAQSQLHIRSQVGESAFRIDTPLTTNFVKHYTNGSRDTFIVGGLSSWGLSHTAVVGGIGILALYHPTNSQARLDFYKGGSREMYLGINGTFNALQTTKRFEFRNQSNINVFTVDAPNGKVFINGSANTWGGTTINIEDEFDIAGSTQLRREFLASNYNNVGDKGNSYPLAFQSAEHILSGTTNILRKNYFRFQNRITAGVLDSALIISNDFQDGNTITSSTDLFRFSNDGDFEILQSGANGKGIIFHDESNGNTYRVSINNGNWNIVNI